MDQAYATLSTAMQHPPAKWPRRSCSTGPTLNGHAQLPGRAFARASAAPLMQARRIGIFGGTFDPVHVGHLVAAVNARSALVLDTVVLVVANVPWQKIGDRTISPAADRLAMVQAAARFAEG